MSLRKTLEHKADYGSCEEMPLSLIEQREASLKLTGKFNVNHIIDVICNQLAKEDNRGNSDLKHIVEINGQLLQATPNEKEKRLAKLAGEVKADPKRLSATQKFCDIVGEFDVIMQYAELPFPLFNTARPVLEKYNATHKAVVKLQQNIRKCPKKIRFFANIISYLKNTRLLLEKCDKLSPADPMVCKK